jgi:hypothetical protein
VEGRAVTESAEALDELLPLGLSRYVVYSDIAPLACQAERDAAPDATLPRGTGDERDLPVEPHAPVMA